MLASMGDTLTLQFSSKDRQDLEAWKTTVSSGEVSIDREQDNGSMKRQVITFPAIEASTAKTREAVEQALEEGNSVPRGREVSLPEELIESAKSSFIASGGNISEVASLYDLTPEAVLRLASQENWPVYGGGTKAIESKSKAQLTSLQIKLWHKIEYMLNALDVEKKHKEDIVQYRVHSEYVEPLASRSSAFKVLMDQYMRVSTLLEPEVFANDPDGANYHARAARGESYPGGIEGVNREMADFLGQVVVGIADRIKDKELKGYGDIIDARAQ